MHTPFPQEGLVLPESAAGIATCVLHDSPPQTLWGILFMDWDLADRLGDKTQSKCWDFIPPETFPEGRGLASLGYNHSKGSYHLFSTYYVLHT